MKYVILILINTLIALSSCSIKQRSPLQVRQDITVMDSLILEGRHSEANDYYTKHHLPDSLLYLKIEAIAELDSLKEIENYLPRLKQTLSERKSHSLSNIKYIYYSGWLKRRRGNSAKADSLFHIANQLYPKLSPKNFALEIQILNGLAFTQRLLGNSKESEILYGKVVTRTAKEEGIESIKYADAKISLAQFYARKYVDDKFERIILETEHTFKKDWEYSHTGIRLYGTLGILYDRKKDYLNAVKYRKKYLDVVLELYGDQHEAYASGISNLGITYRKLGEYDKALEAFGLAKKGFARIFGKVHGAYAAATENEADVFVEMGDYEKALKPYLFVKDTRAKLYGTHLIGYYGNSLKDLANLYTKQGKYDLAAKEYLLLDNVLQSEIRSVFQHLTEEEREQFVKKNYEPYLNAIRSVAAFVPDQEYLQLQYNIALRTKGMQVKTSRDVLEYASKNDSLGLPVIFSLLRNKEAHINQLLKKGQNMDKAKIATTQFTRDSLEKLLVRGSARYREEKTKEEVDYRSIQSSLAEDETAIEFVHYDTGGYKGNDTIVYAALIIKGSTDSIEFIQLFQEQEIGSRLEANARRRRQYVEDLYGSSTRAFSRIQETSLFELVWEPLYPSLNGVKTIYCSPSGLLHRVSLGAIQDREGDPIASKFKLHTLNSTRNIIGIKNEGQNNLNTSFLIGGVDYESYVSGSSNSNTGADTETSYGSSADFEVGRTLRKSVWEPLEFTNREVEDLKKKLEKSNIKSTVLRGVNASEEAFKTLGKSEPSPSVIHIATHGYFFPESTEELDESGNVFTNSEDAMVRSGILLSGANRAWVMDSGDNIPGEDGILTAAEIAQLNLDNTELVVLSACDTGLGDIEGTEGVYGLQRAFKKAGANALMLSLWQVPDELTSKFMERFYQFWLVDKMTLRDAFDAAQKHIRELPNVDTYGWAGFVLLE